MKSIENERVELARLRPADRLFGEIADACDLRADWVRPDEDESWFEIPVQDGLANDCAMLLVNEDELWFTVGGNFTLSIFPFPMVGAEFQERVVDFLQGRSRIRIHRGAAFLEGPEGSGWKTLARYRGLTWYGWRERVVFSDGDRVR